MKSGGYFDVTVKYDEIKNIEEEMNVDGFWDNSEQSNKMVTRLNSLKKEVEEYFKLEKSIKESLELIGLLDNDDLNEIEEEINNIIKSVDSLEISSLLNGPYDELNCYLEIHPGAGGTESCDWANMLLRMYKMFAQNQNFKFEIIDIFDGDEAGIKSVTVHVSGLYAYGYLKCEIGVHRLVRISPFDSNKRRHTSFAAVNVVPEFDSIDEIVIKDEDLRVDVYRSSGHGGQGVNTTDSAVRLTHIPTNIVVTCQNERSQIKNKETALKVLKSKLYSKEIEKRNKEINSIKGNENINFGSQIRNYVLEPYTLVKDLRSNFESTNPTKILDGDILPIIESVLRKRG